MGGNIRKNLKLGKVALILGAGVLVLSGCEMTPKAQDQSISIPYDPYNFDPDELFDQARAYCEAYGLSARYVDETIDPTSVRWRYRHFDCV